MQLSRCPVCHSRISLQALVSDEAGRNLLALISRLERDYGSVLVNYIALFRSPGRDLANDRALRLMEQVQALKYHPDNKKAAMLETTQMMLEKKQSGQFRPLKNHNYLLAILKQQNTTQAGVSGAPDEDKKQEKTHYINKKEAVATLREIKDYLKRH